MLNRQKIHIVIIFCFLLLAESKLIAFQGRPPIIHQVTKGETLYRLSRNYGVSLDELKRMNNFSKNSLQAGQKIIVGYDNNDSILNQPRREETTRNVLVSSLQDLKVRVLAMTSEGNTQRDLTIKTDYSHLFRSQPFENTELQFKNRVLTEQLIQLNRDLGLKTTTNYTNNFEPGFLDAEQLFFTSRISTGLSIELLDNGLLGNNRNAKSIGNEIAINNLLKAKSTKKESYTYHYNHLIYSFNIAKGELLNDRISLIKDFLKIASKLFYVRGISWEEILQLKSELAILHEAVTRIENYNRAFETSYVDLPLEHISTEVLPILNIDLTRLRNTNFTDSLNRKIGSLEQEQLSLSHSRNRDIRLKAEVNYNAISGGSLGGVRTYASLGISFTAPIFKNTRSREIQSTTLDLKVEQRERQLNTIQNELTNIYYEYQYALKQYVAFEGKRAVTLERIRKDRDSQLMAQEDSKTIAMLKKLNELKAIDYEMLEIKQNLYLKVLKMYSLSDMQSISEFTTPRSKIFNDEKNEDERGVYLWSNTLSEINPDFLLSYLKNNDISRVMLSNGANRQMSNRFLEMANAQNISLFKLIGENSYIMKGISPKLEKSIKALGDLYEGVHLDIEPQALPLWEEQKENYTQKLINLYQTAKNQLPKGKKLSVSIPVFLSEEALLKIFEIADEVVIMTYGKADLNFVKRKLSEELKATPALEKITIALRATDFRDRVQLEEFIQGLMSSTNVQRYMIQDLGSMITLDQNTILGDLNQKK